MTSNKAIDAKLARTQLICDNAVNAGVLGLNVGVALLKSLVQEGDDVPVALALMDAAFTDFKPKNAAERMLVEQLVVTHLQVLRAHRRLGGVDNFDRLEQCANITSKLQADFRKTLMALKEWNAPPRAVIHTQQANVANQQVIQQVQAQPEEQH